MEGTYKYFLNDEPTGIIETFSVQNLPDGKIKTISERDASVFGTKIFVETIQSNSVFEKVKIKMLNQNNSDLANVRATYEFSESSFQFKRQINENKTDKETLELPENFIVFPLIRCFQGETILHVAENKSFSNVLVPSIENPEDTNTLLKPTFDERTAEFIKKETIQIKEKTINTSVYKYLSKHYSEDSKFWIDENGLLLKYVFHQSENQIWKIELTQK